MSSEPRYILLYGTLRAGQPAFLEYRLDDSLRPAGYAFIYGQLYDLGEYPGLILNGSRRVRVDRHEILNADVLNRLDVYEEFNPNDIRPFDPRTGHGSVFVRRIIDALGAPAYIYEYNCSIVDTAIIDDEDWLEFVRKRST
jgi:gamma-glutamylcyclotransferase (GGCT)/AIG2-like uncharacterized protein YtfP